MINWGTNRGWDFEKEWPIHVQSPMKPVFCCDISLEHADVLFHDVDCIWAYTGSLFIDPIICLNELA